MALPRNWRPGSFTKNFSWGKPGSGLSHLHEAIEVAFDGKSIDVGREAARGRLRAAGMNDYIPANFFLLNQVNGGSVIVADELVREALAHPADESFDRLAVFALHLSLAGLWQGARPEQRYPAEWAKHFIVSRVFASGQWNGSLMTAGEIASFVSSHPDYSGVWAGKAATNLSYIYELSGVRKLRSGLAEKWWGSAIFLALDRILVDRRWSKPWPTTERVLEALAEEHVFELTAVPVDQGMIAARELIELYFDESKLGRPSAGTEEAGRGPNSRAYLRAEKEALPVQRVYVSASRQIRDQSLITRVRRLYGDRCSVCGEALPVTPEGNTFAEVGHVKPVGLPFRGPDHVSNVLPFCPNHHRQFDRGAIYFEVDGKSAKVVDRTSTLGTRDRMFMPMPEHPLDMSMLEWHASYFRNR